jgi:hypothetical protein
LIEWKIKKEMEEKGRRMLMDGMVDDNKRNGRKREENVN